MRWRWGPGGVEKSGSPVAMAGALKLGVRGVGKRACTRLARAVRSFVALLAVSGLCTGVLVGPASASPWALRVGGLTTNGRVDPLGIGGATPSFGWQLTSPGRGARQSAYQIRVGRRPG